MSDDYTKGPGQTSHVQLGGLPFRAVGDEQAADMVRAGGTPIGQEQAQQDYQAQKDLSYVDQNWGTAGKLAAGVGSGLTLGLGPGLLTRTGLMDPGHLQAAQGSPWYTAGDVAGTVLPAILSGGEGLFARAAEMTPAGLMGLAGGASERLAAGVLGESAGLMGSLASTSLKMAARGATEGSLINMGHTIGSSLVTNGPLSAESIAASGLDGALFGGLIGGTLGSVGAIGSKAVESMGDMTRSIVGKNSRALGLVSKDFGYDSTEVALAEKTPGGAKGLFKQASDILEEGGSKVGDSNAGKLRGVKNAIQKTEDIRADVIRTLESEAPVAVPPVQRIMARLDAEVAAPRIGTANQMRAADFLESASKELNTTKPSWENIVKTRDQWASRLTDEHPNPLLADQNTLRREALNVLDSEIRSAMESSGVEGAADKYGASTIRLKMARDLEANLGKKAANAMLSTEPNVTNRDLMLAATGAALGHQVSAVSYLAGKGVGRLVSQRMEPWMAQMAYNQSVGAKAAQATVDVKSRIGSSVKNFFKNASKAPAKAAQVKHSEDATKHTREAYEAAATRAEQLMSTNHQDKVRRYSESLHQAGYEELAASIMQTNQRAVQYAEWNMPPRQATKAMKSLRAQPMSKIQTLSEMKAMRKLEGIGLGKHGPLGLLDDLEKGKVSRDTVEAFAYVYPELHTELAAQASQHVFEMKASGKYLPMDKIVTLAVALNAPIDSVLEKDFIGGVQASLQAPPANQPQPKPQPASMSVALTQSGLLTPLQSIQNA